MQSFLAIDPHSHFSLQNIPFGIISRPNKTEPSVATIVGDQVIDLAVLHQHQLLAGADDLFNQPTLNKLMAQKRPFVRQLRQTIQTLLSADNTILRDNATLRQQAIHPVQTVTLHLPVAIGDYTDFYSSRQHASNVGEMFRGKDNLLLPNWLHLPVAYHGRASSIVLSGTPIHRPQGQIMPKGANTPIFSPTQELDFELEMGLFIGQGNQLGQPIPIGNANDHIFGFVLANDWSARDIQRWEYRPLGPFLAKNFATTISPWVVTTDALEAFRVPLPTQDPPPLPYLQTDQDYLYNIQLEVYLQTEHMTQPHCISRSNMQHLYWSTNQQVAHHAITGCNMQTGDLLASGTISGNTPDSYGSLLELTWRGQRPLSLPTDHPPRTFLEDGDTLTLTGWCQGDDYRVGFGEASGQILPAIKL